MSEIQEIFGLQEVTTVDWAIILALLIALFSISVAFNNFIDTQKDVDPYGGYNGWYVVVGVTYTLAILFVVLIILIGWTAAVAIAAMFVAFAVALFPMLKGDMKREGRARRDLIEALKRQKEI